MLRLLLPLLFCVSAAADEAVPPVPVAMGTSYLADRELLALNYENHPGWHTYWKNPGDAGLPIRTEFWLDGVETTPEALEWPVPKKFLENGDIVAYGYDGAYSLFFRLPRSAFEGSRVLKIRSRWLVCAHICIPGEKTLELALSEGLATGKNPGEGQLLRRLEALPKPAAFPDYLDLGLALDDEGKGFELLFRIPGPPEAAASDVLVPFPHERFDFDHEALRRDASGALYGIRPVGWDGIYEEPPVPVPTDGTFEPPQTVRFLFDDPVTGEVSVVEKTFAAFDAAGSGGMRAMWEGMAPYDAAAALPAAQGLLFFLLLAFVGGLILNIMPCVLPVISLKLFSLVKHAGASRVDILKHNIFYALGVTATFLALALAVVLLQGAGASVGWGFQLQSPGFVLAMVLVLFVFALNLFGLFEFGVPGGRVLGGLDFGRGPLGDFMGGVLSTILATPCSAPFLGTALAFAFASEPPVVFAVFAAVGLGLAFPFLLVGLFPSCLALIPRPGAWMEAVKKFLGLALILTALWLADVFSSLTGGASSLVVHVAAALLFFAFYFRARVSRNPWAGAFFFALPALLLAGLLNSGLPAPGPAGSALDKGGLPWEPWSEEKMEAYRREGRRVFVDFTADWCFTCKVNEKLVLETEGFRRFVEEENIDLLLADWTRRDEAIGTWLAAQGFVGVPAYFVVRDGRLVALGETITLGEIREAFE